MNSVMGIENLDWKKILSTQSLYFFLGETSLQLVLSCPTIESRSAE